MQVSSSTLAAQLHAFLPSAGSSSRSAPEAPPTPSPSPAASVAVAPEERQPLDGARGRIDELVVRVRIESRVNGEPVDEHDHRHHEARDTRHQLKRIRSAVRSELRDLRHELRANGEDRETLRNVHRLERSFRHELRHAFHSNADHGEVADPERLVNDVRDAFDGLLEGLRSVLGGGAEEEPAPTRVNAPEPPVAPNVSPEDVEAPVPAERPAPVEPERAPEPTRLARVVESLQERVESMFAELRDILAPLLAEMAERSRSDGGRVDVALTLFAEVRFSFSQEPSGSSVDAVS